MLSLMANRAINLFLTVLFLAAFSHGATEQQPTEPAAWSLYDIVTTDTVQTILSDERLRKTYRAAVSACVDTSRNLAEQLQVPELSTISDSLDSHLREFDSQTDTAGRDQLRKRGPSKDTHRDTKRDGFIDGLVSAGAGLGGGAGPALGAAPLPAIPGLPPTPAPPMDSGAGGITGAISQAASGLIGKVVSMSGPAVAQAGFFGGVGAGEGAAQGLNLAPPGTSMTTGAQVAQENGMTSSGFNSAIESAAMGLTATTLRAVRGSNTLQIPNLGPVALAMGGGLGNGAAMGLQLKTGASGPPLNAPGLDGIAGNFAFGLSRSIAESAKASNLMGQMAGPNGATGMILRFAAPAVSGFGKGLGSGAAVGFGLQPPSGPATMPTAARPDGSIDVSGIAQDFASGLTSRFLANGTATNTISGLTGGQGVLGALPPGTLLKFVRPAASGLGKGLGSGTAVGLGLQPDPGPAAMANAPTADGGFDVGGVVQDFASGLTSRFLANGTAINALGAVAGLTGGLGAKMDIRRVTRGLATGMVAGAFDSTQALGGVKAMLGGQAQMPATPVVDTPVPFDDSVGGAATGFGQGLASSAVMTAYKLVSGGVGMKALKSRGTVLLKRGTSAAVSSDSATQVSDRVRDRVTSLLSPKAMSALTQKAVHVLTSQGPGGLTLVALGLGKSGMLSANAFDANTTGFMKDIIPQGTVSFTKNGNTYNLDGQQLSKALNGPLSEAANGLSINGSSFDRFVALMILHIFLAIIIFAFLLPLAVALQSSRNLLLRLHLERFLPIWTCTAARVTWAAGIAPISILVLVLGMMLGPRGAHFQTTHGILGLLTMLVTLAAFALKILPAPCTLLANLDRTYRPIVSQGCCQLLLVLTLPTLMTGASDLSTITQSLTNVVPFEVAVWLGSALGSLLVIGQAISGLDLFLMWGGTEAKSPADQDEWLPNTVTKRELSG